MNANRPTLPTLTVNRRFMMDFIAQEPPCLALGLVEVEGSQCAMITLRLNEALPREVPPPVSLSATRCTAAAGQWSISRSGFTASWPIMC